MADLPQLCVGMARALKEHGTTELDLASAVIKLWLEPDREQGRMLLKATITIGEYHKMVLELGQAGLLPMDAGLPELAHYVAATCNALFYAMPEMFLGLANASCFLQQNTLFDDDEEEEDNA